MPKEVVVHAASRLHFGLFSLGHLSERQYGGVGAMIARPGLQLRITQGSAGEPSGAGEMGTRAVAFAKQWLAFQRMPAAEGNLHLEVVSAPPDHVGLGVGTQLGLAVAAGLSRWMGLPAQTALELALSVGRATRSAVGTYGFLLGGLVMEQGKRSDEPMSLLDCRIDMPGAWRFLLLRPLEGRGISGTAETEAMQALPAVPEEVTQALINEAATRMIPAAATSNFALFAESLYRYGQMAGNCFAAKQGGPYNGPVLTSLVEVIRQCGAVGVGQSSWGPTIFTICDSQGSAEALQQEVQTRFTRGPLAATISPICNQGAAIEVIE